jgi:tagaturonate reductase
MASPTNVPRLDAALAKGDALQRRRDIVPPVPAHLALPERAVQFGTGALLRGLVDAVIDDANRRGDFNGRVVAIGSTGSGRDAVISDQDGLFTLVVQGIVDGMPVVQRRVVSAVSRAVSAVDEWPAVLALARDANVTVVFSNTTEVGIRLDDGEAPPSLTAAPRSFPAKLARFLHERAHEFEFDPTRGVVVVPCELIEGNGDRLRELVLEQARRWGLEPEFTRWIDAAVPFCNTLVDRIVPGAPRGEDAATLTELLGYEDAMITTCEPYHLLAIEGDDRLRARLGFARADAHADAGVVVTPDITPFRLRKVRLLNGGHTIMVPLALLAGCTTVREATRDELVGRFLRRVMLDELVPALEVPGAEAFARRVLDRFANPHIQHQLVDITLHGTAKMRVRVVPSILAHAERHGSAPPSVAFGFAAWLAFMDGRFHDARRAAGLPVPDDSEGAGVRALWDALPNDAPDALRGLAHRVASDTTLWGTDLSAVPGFAHAVSAALVAIRRDGARAALDAHLAADATTEAR